MSRKHYEKIAKIISRRLDIIESWGPDEPTAREHVRQLAGELSDVLEEDNPRFDRDRFLTAAGL